MGRYNQYYHRKQYCAFCGSTEDDALLLYKCENGHIMCKYCRDDNFCEVCGNLFCSKCSGRDGCESCGAEIQVCDSCMEYCNRCGIEYCPNCAESHDHEGFLTQISGVSKKAARFIYNAGYTQEKDLYNATLKDLSHIEGVSKNAATEILSFFVGKRTWDIQGLIEKLKFFIYIFIYGFSYTNYGKRH